MKARLLSAALLLPLTAAYAADPASGTIDAENLSVEWSGGPFVAANIWSDATEPTCLDPVFPCDDFALTVELPDNYIATYPSAVVRIVIQVTDPGANVREDYDLFLYDEAGNLIAESVSEGGTESVSFLADPGSYSFVVRTIPFTTFASAYAGKAEIIPGEPALPIGGEGGDGGSDGRSAQLAGSAGAGGLGLGVFILAACGALRRRR